MKHIVVVIDGTWISAANSDTPFSNAYNLNWMLDNKARDGNAQIVFYSSGIGTDKGARTYFSGATAEGIDNQVREAYINVCSNFRATDEDGRSDKIYLFGFSRGAVVARALSAIISQYGILRPAFMDFFPTLWKRFTNPKQFGSRRFSDSIAHQDVQIEMIGLFDCVFGLQGNNGRYYTLRFTNYSVPKNVKYAVNLVSLDDSRRAFEPMLWDGLSSDDQATTVDQIWCPGVHSDIGGTYQSNALGRIALFSMIDLISQRTDLALHDKSLKRMEAGVSDGIEVNRDLIGAWALISDRSYKRTCGRHFGESIHPIVNILMREPIKRYKGRNTSDYKYVARNAQELQEFEGFRRKDWMHFIFPNGRD